jgi:osmotically-inducible protein OsmY
MKKVRWTLTTASIGLALALGLPGGGEAKEPTTTGNHPTTAEDPANTAEARESAPDNTGRNVRDKKGDTLTPIDQSNKESDVELTRKIREEVVGDDSLSMQAHNVKIISVDGVVTLRGPVKSEGEKSRIASLAEKTAGSGKVHNQLEVAH